jgi:glycosyltransferase involved in cell wall biosynthesis
MIHRLHVVALPHTATRKRTYLHCAFTQNTYNFCKMMHERGHHVIHYGGEGSEAPCSEQVTIVSEAERNTWFKSDWDKGELSDVIYDPSAPYWVTFNTRAIMEIQKRLGDHDIICIIVGYAQAPIVYAFPNRPVCEYAIGYWGTIAPHRNFGCHIWQHYVYGRQGQENGNAFDRAIPHYLDPVDFPLGKHKDDYYLYMGRLIGRKGPHTAAEICKAAGVRLVVAGQGGKASKGKITFPEGEIVGDHVEYVGHAATPKQRADLMGNAKALFVLTQYIGPFEMVHTEAMTTGCPVITTDYGAFVETVQNGVDGYRIRNMREAVEAVQKVKQLDFRKIHERALARFSLDAIAPQYEEWFNSLYGLWWGKGWYEGFEVQKTILPEQPIQKEHKKTTKKKLVREK